MTEANQASQAPAGSTKPKVGFYGLTGCAGCQLSVLFSEDEIVSVLGLIDLISFPFVREKNIDQSFDICIIEGLVADKTDVETLKRLREKSKILVAIGACAHTGNVPAYRHYTLKENYAHLLYEKREGIQDVDATPLDSWVKVDYVIPGCPPDKKEILNFIKALLLGKEPLTYSSPVCIECRRNNNACLLEQNKLCLGPITRGGCNSVCTNGGFECWGCRGQTNDANIPAFVKMLEEKGFTKEDVLTRMRQFVGLKIPQTTMVYFNGNN